MRVSRTRGDNHHGEGRRGGRHRTLLGPEWIILADTQGHGMLRVRTRACACRTDVYWLLGVDWTEFESRPLRNMVESSPVTESNALWPIGAMVGVVLARAFQIVEAISSERGNTRDLHVFFVPKSDSSTEGLYQKL